MTNLAFSQNGIVTGTVTDNTQKALLGVNIHLKNTTKVTQTKENGDFEITNLENGDYVLLISYLGFKTREVSISNNKNTILENVILYEGNDPSKNMYTLNNRYMYKNDSVNKRCSEPFILKILAELSTGKYTKSLLEKLYSIASITINKWIRKYERNDLMNTRVIRETKDKIVHIKVLQKEIDTYLEKLGATY
jgi:hypothetical protein